MRTPTEKAISVLLTLFVLALILPTLGFCDRVPDVHVVDGITGEPIQGAMVALTQEDAGSDITFSASSPGAGNRICVKAPGYAKVERIIRGTSTPAPRILRLTPFNPKALYLSFYGVGEKSLREPALKLIEETELNALVIDVKGDRGMLPYRSSIPLASEVGAQRILTVKDMRCLIQTLRARGIYTIARIVVFKDNLLALAKPDLAAKTSSGEIWRDRENLAWVDPFKKEVWDYNIQIAIEAAQHGFDEIQFDYVRFPDSSAPQFSCPNTEENRVQAISGFLREAKSGLEAYGVFLAADIFGYVCWNPNDTNIGQRLDALIPYLDYVCPMLYPSGFQFGIPGHRNPVENSFEVIYRTLKRAQERTELSSLRFRPWLQAFRDYAFDRRPFQAQEIRSQIDGAESFGTSGWMLWNPSNVYSPGGLRRDDSSPFIAEATHPPRLY